MKRFDSEVIPTSRGRPGTQRKLFDSTLLELLFDHPVHAAANPVHIQPLDQRFLLLDVVHRAFQDVRRIEAWREGTRREVFEGRHELEDGFSFREVRRQR